MSSKVSSKDGSFRGWQWDSSASVFEVPHPIKWMKNRILICRSELKVIFIGLCLLFICFDEEIINCMRPYLLGVYNLMPRSCHQFDQDVFIYNT